MISAYFFEDHRKIDASIARLRRDLDEFPLASSQVHLETLVEAFQALNAHLEQHMRWEEEVIFPAAEARMPELAQGPGRVMRREHVDIRSYLRRLQECFVRHELDEDTRHEIRRALGAAEGVLGEHNEKEETVYYPLCDRLFSAEEAERLLDRLQDVR